MIEFVSQTKNITVRKHYFFFFLKEGIKEIYREIIAKIKAPQSQQQI